MNQEPCTQVTITRSTCPLCLRELRTNWIPDNIPFFGEVMHITSLCECGLKYSDTLILTQHEPMHYEIKVRSPDDLDARIVRSTSGTIRIPELGVDIEPGPASESFISNVEGVLDRVEEILRMVTRWGEEDKTGRALELLSSIEKTRAGNNEITLVIEDPLGNSAIIAGNAVRRKLTDDEVSKLKTGMVVFEKGEVE